MRATAFATMGIAAAIAVGCSTTLPPNTRAAEVERVQCDSASNETADLRMMQDATVLEARPLYSHVLTGSNGMEARVDGAELLIRPPEGVSAERMTRVLQCHGARALLGRVDSSQLRNDPFWLPDAWVSIEVKPQDGNYAVILEADDLSTNLRVAQRALAFASSRGVTPGAAVQ